MSSGSVWKDVLDDLRSDEATAFQRLRNVLVLAVVMIGGIPWLLGTLMLPGILSEPGMASRPETLVFMLTNPFGVMLVLSLIGIFIALPYKLLRYIFRGRGDDTEEAAPRSRSIRQLMLMAVIIVINLTSCSHVFSNMPRL